MKAVVLKVSETEVFNDVIDIFKKQGFDDLTILEECGLKEEKIITRFIELQSQYPYVLVIPPLPPTVTNKIMAKMLAEKEKEEEKQNA